jgi:hypothetical protein
MFIAPSLGRRKRFFLDALCSLHLSNAPLGYLAVGQGRKQKLVPEGTVPHTRNWLHLFDWMPMRMHGCLCNSAEMKTLQALFDLSPGLGPITIYLYGARKEGGCIHDHHSFT